MVDINDKVQLGADGPQVTRVGIGTSALGGMASVYGYDTEADAAVETVRAMLASPINLLDTSNEYGKGESERRIGAAFRTDPGARERTVVITKADPLPDSRDFSGQRVRDSYAESVERMGIDHVDVFFLHDPERFSFDEVMAPGGAMDVAHELKAEGKIDLVGVAGGDITEMRRYLDTGRLDILLNHSQYNLVDRSATDLIDAASAAGIPFVLAAPFGSGLLAKGTRSGARFQYREPSSEVIDVVAAIEGLADSLSIPLAALALQFCLKDPRIATTLVGVTSPRRIEELVANVQFEVPAEIWDQVDELVSKCSM